MVEPGMEFAPQDFRDAAVQGSEERGRRIYATHGNGAWKWKLMINDRIADSIFQQIVTRPDEYSVLATPNLNGDYISDAAAAQVGGLGIAPGRQYRRPARHLRSHPRHGAEVCRQGCHQSWLGHAVRRHDVRLHGVERGGSADRRVRWSRPSSEKKVTYDFERMLEGATKVKTSEFASHMIHNMASSWRIAVEVFWRRTRSTD